MTLNDNPQVRRLDQISLFKRYLFSPHRLQVARTRHALVMCTRVQQQESLLIKKIMF